MGKLIECDGIECQVALPEEEAMKYDWTIIYFTSGYLTPTPEEEKESETDTPFRFLHEECIIPFMEDWIRRGKVIEVVLDDLVREGKVEVLVPEKGNQNRYYTKDQADDDQ